MKRILFGLIVVLFAISSCQKAEKGAHSGAAEITFTFNLPEATPVQTRSNDVQIDNIDILVFDENLKFLERIKVDQLSQMGAQSNFKLRTGITNQARKFHVIANARKTDKVTDRVNFSGLSVGTAEVAAIAQLNTPTLQGGLAEDVFPLIMWGCAQAPAISSQMQPLSFKLLRSQASIEVSVSSDVINQYRFSLTGFSLANVSAYGKVAPSDISSSTPIPTAPAVSGSPLIDYFNSSNTAGPSAPGWSLIAQYLNEQVSGSNPPALIIKGTFSTSAGVGDEGYYKVLLRDESQSKYIDIVRNHRYKVRIVAVSDKGYPTIAEALANPASNTMKINIIEDDPKYPVVVTNAQYTLASSGNYAAYWAFGSQPPVGTRVKIAEIYTNSPTPNFKIETAASPDMMANYMCEATADPKVYLLTAELIHMTTNTSGNTLVMVREGNMSIEISISIIQNNFSKESSDVDSEVYKLLGGTNAPAPFDPTLPWSVELIQQTGPAKMTLHHSDKSAFSYSGQADFGRSLVESRITKNCYLHLLKKNEPFTAELKYSFTDNQAHSRTQYVGHLYITNY